MSDRRSTFGAALLAGFGATAAMWGAAYVARLPAVDAPSSLLGVLMLLCLFGGGVAAGRDTGRVLPGLFAGVVSCAVNLMILGSFLTSGDRSGPSAPVFVGGFFLVGAVLGAAGGFLGRLRPRRAEGTARPGRFARIAVFVTLLLVIAGGIVTTKGAGLAVPDWPASFGSNMFLFPLSRMTGGIYYEHAHRLFGTLVGLTTLVLMIWVLATEGRRWVKGLTVATFLLVVVQGVLGGLRVTDISLALAAVHGVLGQSIFALLVCLAAFLSFAWARSPAPEPSTRVSLDRKLGVALAVFLLLQIALGAVLRHFDKMMHAHITVAVLVFVLALVAGFRAWGLYPENAPVRRAGVALLALAVLQLILGFAALAARGMHADTATRGPFTTLVITAHQATGALLLAATALHLVWIRRLLRPTQEEPRTQA